MAQLSSELQPVAPHATLPRYYSVPEERKAFVRHIFDQAAGSYNHVERMMALGTGGWYRRKALLRAGLTPGMRVLDVAVGTGLTARQIIEVIGDRRGVIGIDPSRGMLNEAVRLLGLSAVIATGEHLPVADNSFDFLSMGYALRHLSDLAVAFKEFHRALKPGGRLCLLEITRPAGRMSLGLVRCYMKIIVPFLTRMTTRHADSQKLWEYYWDTIEHCVPPQRVMEVLEAAGFSQVKRRVELGIFSEYTAITTMKG